MDALGTQRGRIDGIIPMDTFNQMARESLPQGERLSANDLRILLVYLSRDKHELEYNDKVSAQHAR